MLRKQDNLALARLAIGAFMILGLATPRLSAAIQLNMTPSPAPPQPVGTVVTWQVTASDTDAGTLSYRFSVGLTSTTMLIRRDFSLSNSWNWAPTSGEGLYHVTVTVRNNSTQHIAQTTMIYWATSRVVNGVPAVSNTANPLVALYSAPPCPSGSLVRVRFKRSGALSSDVTNFKGCGPRSANFYIAGMRGNSTYTMNYEVVTGGLVTPGPTPLQFQTGAPVGTFPTMQILHPIDNKTSIGTDVVLHAYTGPPPPAAHDLQGNLIWYASLPGGALVTRPVNGGTMLGISSGLGGNPSVQAAQLLREFDLAGNIIAETNVTRVSEQLAQIGQDPISAFHHEVLRLPNGNTVAFGAVERLFPAGTQGVALGPVDILGDLVVVLDPNLQLVWAWNSFDHDGGGTQLDINRPALLGEICNFNNTIPGCPPLFLAGQTPSNTANDWLHGNAISYIASEGNLLLSFRHQDWVVKVDYRDGAGTGNILWRLGQGGEFQLSGATDPYPWFSHQHDPGFEADGTLSLFDNGNTRAALNVGLTENSRGQIWSLDQTNMLATPVLNADLGVFSFAVGRAQKLPNGNSSFGAGFVGNPPNATSQTMEVTPAGTLDYIMSSTAASYRDFRLFNLYTAPAK